LLALATTKTLGNVLNYQILLNISDFGATSIPRPQSYATKDLGDTRTLEKTLSFWKKNQALHHFLIVFTTLLLDLQ